MWALYHTIVVKRELSQTAKLLIYQAICVLTMTYYHGSLIQETKMRHDSEKQGVEQAHPQRAGTRVLVPLCFERSQLSWCQSTSNLEEMLG